jgi:hypothetical protein
MNRKDLDDFYRSTDLMGEDYNPLQELRFTELATFMRVPLMRKLERMDTGIVGINH